MSAGDPIRVLVIDDSPYSRQTICHMLEPSPLVDVVATAANGEEALRKTAELRPDLITVDLEMPRMDGFTFLRIVMSKWPTPIIVISGRGDQGDVFKALELGAVDFIAKPTPHATPMLASIERELIRKVHSVREMRMEKVQSRVESVPAPVTRSEVEEAPQAVVIGSSTGGPAALMQIFGAFSEAPPCAFVVAQHMPAGFTQGFAERLDRLTVFRAREARTGDRLEPGTILVAPGGEHLEFESRDGRPALRVRCESGADKYAPSVDRLFESAAKSFGSDLLGIVLTGMGDDGSAGVQAIQAAGGSVIAESEETAVIFGMPRQAIKTGAVDRILRLEDIATSIKRGAGLPISEQESWGGRPGKGLQ